jgi:hypothetical protein
VISIFHGRGITKSGVYAQVGVDMRKHLHVFRGKRNSDPFVVFMCIALHANEHGWAWPSRELIREETGISTEHALTNALAALREITIEGQRVFAHYRAKEENGQWGRSAYLIFPDVECGPAPFENLHEYDPSKPHVVEPQSVILPGRLKLKRIRPDQEVFSALLGFYRKDLRFLTKREEGRLRSLGKELREKGVGADQIMTATSLWKRHDWRGQQGQPPTTTEHLYSILSRMAKGDFEKKKEVVRGI